RGRAEAVAHQPRPRPSGAPAGALRRCGLPAARARGREGAPRARLHAGRPRGRRAGARRRRGGGLGRHHGRAAGGHVDRRPDRRSAHGRRARRGRVAARPVPGGGADLLSATFRVWAPRASRVDLVVNGERRAMSAAPGGWWTAPGATPGARYGFSLDGGDVRPDPRSPFQPDGVLGLSEVIDHARFTWQDGEWQGADLAGAVIYELHVGAFTPEGTFDSTIEKLPHLVDLGVTAVEILPVAEFGGDHGWGYDGASLYAPHHAYGGPDGLKRLVDACHRSGLAVILDVVYNHLGPVGNFLGEFGPYFTERYHTPWGAALNFDGRGSDEVRRFFVDNALMWLRDYHFDGLRLDAVHAILDQSPTH